MWKHSVPFSPSPTEPLRAPGSFTYLLNLVWQPGAHTIQAPKDPTAWWDVPLPPTAPVVLVFLSSFPLTLPSLPFSLSFSLSLTSTIFYLYKLPAGLFHILASLQHLGQLPHPPKANRGSAVDYILHCIYVLGYKQQFSDAQREAGRGWGEVSKGGQWETSVIVSTINK